MHNAQSVLEGCASIAVLPGAGLSTGSAIPDFRGPNGLWTTDPDAEMLSDFDHYVSDASIRVRAWRSRLQSPVWTATPNAGHLALVTLERAGRLAGIVTQNIDGLHQLAGSAPHLVNEVHGSVHRAICLTCGHEQPIEIILERVAAGEEDPRCRDGAFNCGGILKSSTISFGQSLLPHLMDDAVATVANADALLAVGTTLGVHPVASIVPLASRAGLPVIIANRGETRYDHLADVLFVGD
jgi:NAD-dependent deacetylase